MKKRLLKHLPFSNLEPGDVIYRGGRGTGGEFTISGGKTYYAGGGSSDNGIQGFNNSEEDILEKVWEDSEWFEDADLKHIDFIAKNDSITLRFKSIDIDDAEDLARGIMHILPEIENGNWAWNKFKGITTEMKNN
jgi:hypothetical protein